MCSSHFIISNVSTHAFSTDTHNLICFTVFNQIHLLIAVIFLSHLFYPLLAASIQRFLFLQTLFRSSLTSPYGPILNPTLSPSHAVGRNNRPSHTRSAFPLPTWQIPQYGVWLCVVNAMKNLSDNCHWRPEWLHVNTLSFHKLSKLQHSFLVYLLI